MNPRTEQPTSRRRAVIDRATAWLPLTAVCFGFFLAAVLRADEPDARWQSQALRIGRDVEQARWLIGRGDVPAATQCWTQGWRRAIDLIARCPPTEAAFARPPLERLLKLGEELAPGQTDWPDLAPLAAFVAASPPPPSPPTAEPASAQTPPAEDAAGESEPGVTSEPASGAMLPPGDRVSFSLSIAPLLAESCAECHIDPPQVRGGLNLATFDSLNQGGDSGPLFRAGDGSESLLVRKLRGTAQGRPMPLDEDPLPEATIRAIEAWIDQGAEFDGSRSSATLAQVAARARAAQTSHEELAAQRAARAAQQWQAIRKDQPPIVHESEHLIAVAGESPRDLQRFSQIAESVTNRVKSALRVDPKEPLIKGKVVCYLFRDRLDYVEFGRVVELRELPRESTHHWGEAGADVYVAALLLPPEYDAFRSTLARRLAAAHVTGLAADVPTWFAEGLGYWVASRAYPNDPQVQQWERRAAELLPTQPAADAFLTGQIPDEDAALIAAQFIAYLKARGGTRFNKLLDQLAEGKSFEPTFSSTFGGTPTQLLQSN